MPAEFITQTVDDSGNVRGQICMAAGNANLPIIVYTTNSGEVKMAQQTPEAEWIVSTLPGEPAQFDEYRLSLDLDSSGEPHVAYASALTDRLIYGARKGAWQFEEVFTGAGLFPDHVRFPCMRLYKGRQEAFAEFKDAPHFCFQKLGILELWHAAKLRPRDKPLAAPIWKKNVLPVDDTEGMEAGWYATLEFGPDDNLEIAYFDDLSRLAGFGPQRRLHLASMIHSEQSLDRPARDNGWSLAMLDGNDILGEHPALAHSGPGAGAVSYINQRGGTLKLCRFGMPDGGPPVVEDVAKVGVDGFRSSLALSPQSNWCIVYGSDSRLRFATRTAAKTFAIDDVDAGGEWSYLVFDKEGAGHVAHVAGGTLKYAKVLSDE